MKRQQTTEPPSSTPEQTALKLQLSRMDESVKRMGELLADPALTVKQRRDLIAEELVHVQEVGKSAMRLVFKI